jgi:hypothetical protein
MVIAAAASQQQHKQQQQQGALDLTAAPESNMDVEGQQQQQQQQQRDGWAAAAVAGKPTDSVTGVAWSSQQQQQQLDGLAAAAAAGAHREALQSAGTASMTAAEAAPRRSTRLASSKQQQQEPAVQVKAETTAAEGALGPRLDATEFASILAFSKQQQEVASSQGREAKRHRADEPPARSGHSSGLDAELSDGDVLDDTAGDAGQVRFTVDVVLQV